VRTKELERGRLGSIILVLLGRAGAALQLVVEWSFKCRRDRRADGMKANAGPEPDTKRH
jgi:hypothetical protein